MMKNGIFASLALAAALGIFASASLGGPIEDRRELMKANGRTMKLLGGMVQGESPFDAAVVKQQAEAMTARFETVRSLFPPESDQGPPQTYAKADIWNNPEEFAAGLDRAIEASRALAAVTEHAQLMPALGTMGEACKNCHDKFTVPKD